MFKQFITNSHSNLRAAAGAPAAGAPADVVNEGHLQRITITTILLEQLKATGDSSVIFSSSWSCDDSSLHVWSPLRPPVCPSPWSACVLSPWRLSGAERTGKRPLMQVQLEAPAASPARPVCQSYLVLFGFPAIFVITMVVPLLLVLKTALLFFLLN